MKKKGIDISKWQEKVDFSKVKKEVEFVILREGYRKQVDPRFMEYVQGCKNNGIPIVGVYHFCYATSEAGAVEEAKACIANIEKAGLDKKDIVVFFDFEYDTVKQAKDKGVTLGKKQCIAFTRAFCDYVEAQGYTAGVYSNLDYYKNMYDKETIAKYIYWLADYTGAPDVDCTYHQYTSSGKVSGINGNVDMNYFYGEEKEKEPEGVTAKDVLAVMESWVGKSRAKGTHKDIIDLYNSHTPRARGYKVTYKDAYCDTTVSAVFIKLGAVDLIGGTECGVEKHIDIFKKKGIWNENGSITPEPGDIVCFNWDDGTQPNDGYADHIGFVYAVDKSKGTMTFVEGNMNGGVVGYRYNVPIGWGYIRGYAKPKYATKSSGNGAASTAKKSIETIAREVISGQWGNGDARKSALKSAGYDYDAVQKKVNEILSGASQKPAKTNTEIAKEVISGKWGNGDDRKKKLTAAGYNFTEIQRKVNEILGKKSVTAVAQEVVAGKWGNGSERKRKLMQAGYDYAAVQKEVNRLIR